MLKLLLLLFLLLLLLIYISSACGGGEEVGVSRICDAINHIGINSKLISKPVEEEEDEGDLHEICILKGGGAGR